MASTDHEGPQEIDYDEIESQEFVGEGSFGVVHRAIWRGTEVAVKNITTEAEKEAFTVEFRQLSRVNHENIVRLYGACTKGPNICLVMEYAEGGSLFNVLHNSPKLHYHVGNAISWAMQCAKGVAYLHAMQPKPLIHRDLKPPNLLLIMGGTKLKICDFGTAADKSTYMTNNKGSAAWMAPEVFSSEKYTEKCDVFSWGIILWELLSRRKPFYHQGGHAFSIMWAVYKGERPALLKDCPKPLEKLMVRCWDTNPSHRPSMQEVVEIMSKLIQFFPGGDQPIRYLEEKVWSDKECDAADTNTKEQFPSNTESSRQITLSQPTQEMLQPLSIQVDPNSWQMDEYTDMELQTMPGLDRMVPRTGTASSAQRTQTRTVPDEGDTDSNLDNMYLLLDPHLRPATPDQNDPESMALFEKHKQMAQEFLKVQTEMAYLSQRKKKLQEAQTLEHQKKRQNIEQLQSEKEALILLKESLQKQKELLNPSRSQESYEGWVYVSPNNNE